MVRFYPLHILYFFIHGFMALWVLLASFNVVKSSLGERPGASLSMTQCSQMGRRLCPAARKPKLFWVSELMETFLVVMLAKRNPCFVFQRGAYASKPTLSPVGTVSRSPSRVDGAEMKWVQSIHLLPKCFIIWTVAQVQPRLHFVPSFPCISCPSLSLNEAQTVLNKIQLSCLEFLITVGVAWKKFMWQRWLMVNFPKNV